MAVKFLQQHTIGSLYNEGEIASFDRETERDLIKREIAEAHKAKEPAQEPAK